MLLSHFWRLAAEHGWVGQVCRALMVLLGQADATAASNLGQQLLSWTCVWVMAAGWSRAPTTPCAVCCCGWVQHQPVVQSLACSAKASGLVYSVWSSSSTAAFLLFDIFSRDQILLLCISSPVWSSIFELSSQHRPLLSTFSRWLGAWGWAYSLTVVWLTHCQAGCFSPNQLPKSHALQSF